MRGGGPVAVQGLPGSGRVRPGPEGGRRGSAVAPLSALDVPHEVDDDLALLGIIPEIFIDFLRSFRWLNMRDNHTPARGIMVENPSPVQGILEKILPKGLQNLPEGRA